MSKKPASIIDEKEHLEKMQLDKLKKANKDKDKEQDKNDTEIVIKENKIMKDRDDNSLSVDITKESNDSNKTGLNSNSNSNSDNNDDNYTSEKKDALNETKENEEKENKTEDLSNIGFFSSKDIKNIIEKMNDKFVKLEQDMERRNKEMNQEMEKKTNEMKQEMKQEMEQKTKVMKQEMEQKTNEMKQEMEQKDIKISELKMEMNNQKNKLEDMISILGTIQMRDRAKNVLREYKNLLDDDDKKILEKDKRKKWELIKNKIIQRYKNHENCPKYLIFCEIVEKCVKTIKEGNNDAHSVKLDYYESQIKEFSNNNKILIKSPDILCFLIYIKISENSLLEAYELMDKYYGNNMELKSWRGNNRVESSFN